MGRNLTFQKFSSANPALLRLQQARGVLLLQGPVGAFFDRLATWLMQHGVRVHRVAFHGGDVFDSRVIEPTAFTQAFGEWPHVLTSFIQDKEIDCLVLFGQSRRHHKTAIAIGKNLGLAVVVLEEGYFRPGFVTMELDGVNGYSTTLHNFAWSPTALPVAKGDSVPRGQEGISPDISPWHFQKMALQASLHYQAMWKARREFVHYQHHRADHPTDYATYWMRSWFRKVIPVSQIVVAEVCRDVRTRSLPDAAQR